MVNIFGSANDKKFSWEKLGNIKEGRPDLGDHLPVEVYRQLEFSLIEVLTKRYGAETSNAIFKEAGAIAGIEFTKKHLNTNASFKDFMTDLYKILYKLRIGILHSSIYRFIGIKIRIVFSHGSFIVVGGRDHRR